MFASPPTSAKKLEAMRPRRSRRIRRYLADRLQGVARLATIPWQNAMTTSFGPAKDPGGTACPPVHRNGARSCNWLRAYSTLEAEHETFPAVVVDDTDAPAGS